MSRYVFGYYVNLVVSRKHTIIITALLSIYVYVVNVSTESCKAHRQTDGETDGWVRRRIDVEIDKHPKLDGHL